MNEEDKRLEDHFKDYLLSIPNFRVIEEIALNNDWGKIYMIGRSVYQGTSMMAHEKVEVPPNLIHFATEKTPEKIELPSWLSLKKFNGSYLEIPIRDFSVKVTPLEKFRQISARHVLPYITHFLSGTPLNVHSLAFDMWDKKLIGDRGISAINTRTVAINNLETAKVIALQKRMSIEEMIERKARELNFTAIYPTNN